MVWAQVIGAIVQKVNSQVQRNQEIKNLRNSGVVRPSQPTSDAKPAFTLDPGDYYLNKQEAEAQAESAPSLQPSQDQAQAVAPQRPNYQFGTMSPTLQLGALEIDRRVQAFNQGYGAGRADYEGVL